MHHERREIIKNIRYLLSPVHSLTYFPINIEIINNKMITAANKNDNKMLL
jgi:hypothetical protein